MASQEQELLGLYLDRLRGEATTTISPDIQGQREARNILDTAVGTKSITRSDLKKAIWLYAGKQSTEEERAVVGSKMLTFLNKRQIKLAT